MSVYKDPKTGKWFCMYRIKDIRGKRKQIKKTGFKTKELAYKYECSKIVDSDLYFNKRIKVKELYKKYIEYYKDLRSPSTIRAYYYIYKNCLVTLKDKYVSDITFDDLVYFRKQLLSKGYSVDRINTIVSLIKSLLNYAIKYSYLQNNPCLLLDSLKDYSINVSKVDFYTVEEFKQFISVIPKDNIFYVAFNVLYYTGLRCGELLSLNVSDVDLKNSVIKVNKTLVRDISGKQLVKTAKTNSSNDNVYIPNNLKKILELYLLKLNPNNPLLIYNGHRLSVKTLENYKNKYCDDSGLRRIRLHDFRHSFASLIYELSDYNFSEVAKRLRHSNVSTVMKTYIHVFPNRKNEVDNKLDLL